jgi:hypothetical protein
MKEGKGAGFDVPHSLWQHSKIESTIRAGLHEASREARQVNM